MKKGLQKARCRNGETVTGGRLTANPVQKSYSVVEFLINSPSVLLTTVYYNWSLITEDYDDNKFVDCAIAANVDYLITEDGHFTTLKKVEFPKVNVVSLAEFESILGFK